MTPHQPNAAELAVLTVLLIQRYSKDRKKDVSRFRIARDSLKRLAIRARLHDTLIQDWIDVMELEHDWLVIVGNDEFMLIRAEATKSWTKIATKRCDDIIRRLGKGDSSAIGDADDELEKKSEADEFDEEGDE